MEATRHRLDGLEHDNLLAFLALLGTLRAIGTADADTIESERLYPRATWDVDQPPLRPILCVARSVSRHELARRIADGLALVARFYDFDGRRGLDYPEKEGREKLEKAASSASVSNRSYADLLAALMTDASVKEQNKERVLEATPLCLLFGQGHQHFLERMANVPPMEVPPARRGRDAHASAADVVASALFEPWAREDASPSFRWDPEEDVRYALMAGNPTSPQYKPGTQHGANRLAVAGLSTLPTSPVRRGHRIRPVVPGGMFDGRGFSFAWPVWTAPATLAAIRAMLSDPRLREPGALDYLGVDHVVVARRISVGKFMNFSRARVL